MTERQQISFNLPAQAVALWEDMGRGYPPTTVVIASLAALSVLTPEDQRHALELAGRLNQRGIDAAEADQRVEIILQWCRAQGAARGAVDADLRGMGRGTPRARKKGQR